MKWRGACSCRQARRNNSKWQAVNKPSSVVQRREVKHVDLLGCFVLDLAGALVRLFALRVLACATCFVCQPLSNKHHPAQQPLQPPQTPHHRPKEGASSAMKKCRSFLFLFFSFPSFLFPFFVLVACCLVVVLCRFLVLFLLSFRVWWLFLCVCVIAWCAEDWRVGVKRDTGWLCCCAANHWMIST